MTIGKLCIEVTPTDKLAFISETLCIGCGICVKVRIYNQLRNESKYSSFPPFAEMSV